MPTYSKSQEVPAPVAEELPPPPNVSRANHSDATRATDTDFYRAAIGPNNQEYYLRQFERFDQAGKTHMTWHWPALFVPFFWLLYRKMWGKAALYFFAPYIGFFFIGVLEGLLGGNGKFTEVLSSVLVIAILLGPPLFANSLYYSHCRKKIAAAQSVTMRDNQAISAVARNGGTSSAAYGVVMVLVSIAVIGILAAIALPAYQEYTTRAQTSEAANIGKEATDAIDQYINRYQRAPGNLAQAGFFTPSSRNISFVDFDAETGTVSVVMANSPVAGKSILWTPTDNKKNISWVCSSRDIKDSYLPYHCRAK